MTLEELKADHPELYKAIFEQGVVAEKDRCQAWIAFNDVDPKAVAEGIDKGENISQKAMAEFSRKALSNEALAKLEEGAAKDTKTEEGPELTAAKQELIAAKESGDATAIAAAETKVEAMTKAAGDKDDPDAKNLNTFEAEVKEKMNLK